MFEVKDDDIYLTRGDTALLEIEVLDDFGQKYELKPTDSLVLTVKEDVYSNDIILQKKADLKGLIEISHKDTEKLYFKTYVYDVQLTQPNEVVTTIVTPHKFVIATEVNDGY